MEDYQAAAKEFRKISGYKDADDMALECDTISRRLEKKLLRNRLLAIGLTVAGVIAAIIVLVYYLTTF